MGHKSTKLFQTVFSPLKKLLVIELVKEREHFKEKGSHREEAREGDVQKKINK